MIDLKPYKKYIAYDSVFLDLEYVILTKILKEQKDLDKLKKSN